MSTPKTPSQPSPPPPSKPPVLHHITTVDTSLSAAIHGLFTFLPRSLLKLLELSGDGRLWFPIALSLLLSPLSLHSPSLYSVALSLLIGFVSDIAAVGLLKHLVRRPRPVYNSYPMGPTFAVDHWSFPSGHASRSCFVAAIFDLSISAVRDGVDELRVWDREIVDRWIGEWGRSESVLVLIVWIWAISTSISRVLLGRHYVSDVVFGAVVGVLNAAFVYRFLKF